jgi:diacylglycerol O-acyltransferase
MESASRILCRTRSTLNHVALTCLDGALHRYLRDEGVELKRPITIQMPVNLRKEGEQRTGNKIGIIPVELSPPTDDPYVRLRNIGFSLRNVRTMIDSVERRRDRVLHADHRRRRAAGRNAEAQQAPAADRQYLVSNMPGPPSFCTSRARRMEELHPISTLPAGNLLNITLFSYAGQLFFGLIASDELPNLQRLGATSAKPSANSNSPSWT